MAMTSRNGDRTSRSRADPTTSIILLIPRRTGLSQHGEKTGRSDCLSEAVKVMEFIARTLTLQKTWRFRRQSNAYGCHFTPDADREPLRCGQSQRSTCQARLLRKFD